MNKIKKEDVKDFDDFAEFLKAFKRIIDVKIENDAVYDKDFEEDKKDYREKLLLVAEKIVKVTEKLF